MYAKQRLPSHVVHSGESWPRIQADYYAGRTDGWTLIDCALALYYQTVVGQAIKSRISRTACWKPTIKARATMLWPMFSSDMLGIAAIGCTFR